MYFSKITILSLIASVMAMPAVPMKKRALEIQDYSEFQISDGVAGNALEEVSQMFPVSFQLPYIKYIQNLTNGPILNRLRSSRPILPGSLMRTLRF